MSTQITEQIRCTYSNSKHLFVFTLFRSIRSKLSTSAARLREREKAAIVTHRGWKLKAALWSLFLEHNCKYFSK